MKGFSMAYLVLGLVLFLGVHSVRIVADGWRTQTLARMGEMPWKGSYSLVSAVGLALIVWGYGLARQQPGGLWVPPIGMRGAGTFAVQRQPSRCVAVWQLFAVGRAELSGRTAARPGDEHRLRARHCGGHGRGRGGGRCGLGGLCVLGTCLADRRCASRAGGWQGLGAALQDQIPENPRFPFLFSFPLPFHTEPSA